MSEPAIRLNDLDRLAGLLPDCTPPRAVAEIARAAIEMNRDVTAAPDEAPIPGEAEEPVQTRFGPWSPAEDELLVAMYADARSVPEIAAALARTIKAVEMRRRRLASRGCAEARPRFPARAPGLGKVWTKDEEDVLSRMWAQGASVADIAAALPGRTDRSIAMRRRALGLAGREPAASAATRRQNAEAPGMTPRPETDAKAAVEVADHVARVDVQPVPASERRDEVAVPAAPASGPLKATGNGASGVDAILEAMAELDDSFEPIDDKALVDQRYFGAGFPGIAEELGCDEATAKARWRAILKCRVQNSGGIITKKGWADLRAAVARRAAEAGV